MKWFDTVVAWLFPSVLVEGTPWAHMWNEKERESFLFACRIFFPVVAITYLAHFFFYDRPNHLEPIEMWLAFRVSMTALAIGVFGFYMSRLANGVAYKVPALVMCWVICQSQAYVALWHGLESWVFCYILILACVLVLRLSSFHSLLFVLLTVLTQAPVLLTANIESPLIFTGSFVTVVITLVARSSYLSEVQSFLLNQENVAAQKRIIELNLEFADRIRSFIPKVIAQRIDTCMDERRMSAIEASIEVLTPSIRPVACLFSDIRGFTQQSKDIEAFIRDSVVPEVKACTDAIEDFHGIPRKVGDLIFAYFDGRSLEGNLLACVVSGMTVSRLNHDMNLTVNSKEIKRYVLISCGPALVGNLGGLDSSIEITALGTPVNFLSRVDEVTKHPTVAAHLTPGDLVLCEASSRILSELVPHLSLVRLDLGQLGVSVRDFRDVSYLFALSPTDTNYSNLIRALDGITKDNKYRGSRKVAA